MAEKIIGAELILEDILVLQKYAENKIVVELGTFLGGGSYLLSKVAKKLITIDVFEDIHLIEEESNRKHYEFLFQNNPRYYEDIKKILSDCHNIEVIKNLTYKESKNHNNIEMIFIDADHSYEGVKKDFINWFPKIIENGIIAFHDSDINNGWVGIPKFVEELKQDNRLEFLEIKGSVSIFRKKI